jgi:hypothetical protein
MPPRPSPTSRWLTAATWPVGIALTSWSYMWRTTALHRREIVEADLSEHLPPPYPEGVDDTEVQGVPLGYGPMFHRRYTTMIRDSPLSPEQLMDRLKHDLNAAAPTSFARFLRVGGDGEMLQLGDEYVVRMPGPWDGPVRIIATTERMFRLATLDGHLEAGQIEFRTGPAGEDGTMLGFEIESWARSSGRFSDLLYHHAHMSKEVQAHMWMSFLEGVVKLSEGRMTDGIDIDTRRVEAVEPQLESASEFEPA